jgi:hypothetical protein
MIDFFLAAYLFSGSILIVFAIGQMRGEDFPGKDKFLAINFLLFLYILNPLVWLWIIWKSLYEDNIHERPSHGAPTSSNTA